MKAEWKFERKRHSQKSRDPMQASFFTNASIDDDTHALVREAIQNSLDARVDEKQPVRVRFAIEEHSLASNVMSKYLNKEAWKHFNAADNGLIDPPTETDDCRYLVYEDFNTHGLIGDECASEPSPGNSFYYFMRAEGQSGKDEGDRGRHGIGKYVFPYTSGIRMFLAATVRHSDKRVMVAGQSVLKSHHVAGQQYTPDAWWGVFQKEGMDDYFQLPSEDPNTFSEIINDFDLKRSASDSGLSLIMPYVHKEVSGKKIAEHVASEYFWPILSGNLEVDISVGKKSWVVNGNSLTNKLDGLLGKSKSEELKPFIKLANRAILEDNLTRVDLSLNSKIGAPKWVDSYLAKNNSEKISRSISEAGGLVRIKCPLYVRKTKEKESESYFYIYILKDSEDKQYCTRFLREGIMIPDNRSSKVRGYISMVVVESGHLATLLGDSENPAHTEWEKNATKFKGKYSWGPSTIDFVRLSVSKVIKLLNQSDSEEDINLLSDIFYIDLPESDEDVPKTRKESKKPNNSGGDNNPGEPTHIPAPRPRTYRLNKHDNGFSLIGPENDFDGQREYTIRIAYDLVGASKSKALKKWHKNDFEIEKGRYVGKPILDNVDEFYCEGNLIKFSASTNEFSVVVDGFDPNRDLIVDVKSKGVLNEEV